MSQGEFNNELPRWSLGDRLRKARTRAGLEQADMARLLGVSQVAISRWEHDQVQPKDLLAVVRRWAELTGVPEAWLLGVEPPRILVVSGELQPV